MVWVTRMHERTTPVADQARGPLPPDLGTALAILAEGSAAIGQASQQVATLPPAERLDALVAPVLGLLRDRLGFDIAWIVIGDGQHAPQLVRCVLGASSAVLESEDFASAVMPALAAFRLSAEQGQPAPSTWLADPLTSETDAALVGTVAALGLSAVF